MKREVVGHLIFFVLVFTFYTLIKRYFSFSVWPLWLGGIIGTFLPDIDHILYVLVFRPLDLTSQRFIYFLKNKEYKESIRLLYDTRMERQNMIFHSVNFQLIFLVLFFWMMSSSGSLFGKGLTLAFFVHLFKDDLDDYRQGKVIFLDSEKTRIFVIGLLLALLIIPLLF